MQNLNHVCSHFWNLPNTSNNSVIQDNPHRPQDYSENYPFFQQNRNKQQTPYYTKNLSSDDDDYHQLDFLHHIHKNIAHKDRDNLNHPKI